jgi:CheY-like chemotaxis protein
VIATSGTEGLLLLEKSSFDAVLLDFHMEDMTGLQVLELVSAETLVSTPFIMHTASNAVPDSAAIGFIRKPCNIDDLPKLINGFINKFKEAL